MFTFYEFFAGGGMARAGLGPGWRCLFANDYDLKKAATYRTNWGGDAFRCEDVRKLKVSDIPGSADLVWASFPCQDLSLAGGGAGLKGDRSGTFLPFWDLMLSLVKDGRAPTLLVLENVCGTLTSHGGKDFAAICDKLRDGDYLVGGIIIDAALFVPQSRPRLFVVGVHRNYSIPANLLAATPQEPWHPRTLRTAFEKLSPESKRNWIWWQIALPATRNSTLADVLEDEPTDVRWHSPSETNYLLEMMTEVNRQKIARAKSAGRRMVGTIYRRTRVDQNGIKVQRAEVRFDDVAGCLRTPAGGSSRQLILVVEGDTVRSRLISSRETARLMGLPDDYVLPTNYNEAYHLTGDGVVVHVVRHLAEKILEPILTHNQKPSQRAA